MLKFYLKIFSKLPLLKRIVLLYQHRSDLISENEQLRNDFKEFKAQNVRGINNLVELIVTNDNQYQLNNIETKVLHICAADWGGGGNLLALDLHNSLLKMGLESKMLVGNKKTDSDLIDSYIDNEIFNGKWLKSISQAAKQEGLIELLNLASFDILNHPWVKESTVIHIHNIHGDLFSMYILPLICKNKKVVWTLHDMFPYTGHCGYSFECDKWMKNCNTCLFLNIYPELEVDNSRYLLEVKKKIFDLVNPIFVSPSNWQFNNAEKSIIGGFANVKIYNGIDEDVYQKSDKFEIRNKFGIDKEKKVLIYIGNLGVKNPFKGVEYIIQLSNWVNKNNDYQLLIIGGDKDYIDVNVRYISYIKDKKILAQYISAADVFVMPSLQEVFGLVAAESMACGTPVVAFETGGIVEIIDHKENGFLSKYKDFDDLICGIEYICNLNNDFFNVMSDKAIKKVKAVFCTDKMAEAYKQVYSNE